MKALAVVVVSHDGGEDLMAALASVEAGGRPDELVVVDNASADGGPDAVERSFPWARVIRNRTNLGFAAAANQGIRATTAPVVVLLNQDAVVSIGCLDALAEAFDALPGAAVVGALVRNPDGSVQPTKRRFPTLWQAALHATVGSFWPNNPGTRAYVLADRPLEERSRVDWVAGTAMAVRRDAFESVGGFDERFFFFVEDVDLCRRLIDAGHEVWFEPAAEIVHRWGGSWTRRPLRFLWIHHVNLFRYVLKHRRGAWVLAYPLIAAGLAVRFGLLALRWLVTRRSVPEHRRHV